MGPGSEGGRSLWNSDTLWHICANAAVQTKAEHLNFLVTEKPLPVIIVLHTTSGDSEEAAAPPPPPPPAAATKCTQA